MGKPAWHHSISDSPSETLVFSYDEFDAWREGGREAESETKMKARRGQGEAGGEDRGGEGRDGRDRGEEEGGKEATTQRTPLWKRCGNGGFIPWAKQSCWS